MIETCTKHLVLITHTGRTKHTLLIPKVNEQIICHHDKSNHSRAQKERNWSLKLQFFLQNSTWMQYRSTLTPQVPHFQAAGHYLPIYIPLLLLRWPNKGRSLLDQVSLPLPHHLNRSRDPCVRQPGLAATSPSRLLQESYYLHHHGLGEVRSVKKTQPKQKETEETQERDATQGIFFSQLGKTTLFKSTNSKIE